MRSEMPKDAIGKPTKVGACYQAKPSRQSDDSPSARQMRRIMASLEKRAAKRQQKKAAAK